MSIKTHVIYEYESIAPDTYGNFCAFWYKNINVPIELEGKFDPNCCFTFNIKKGNQIFICSNNKLRCIKPMKTILKRLHNGCIQKNTRNKPNIYESLNSKASAS